MVKNINYLYKENYLYMLVQMLLNDEIHVKNLIFYHMLLKKSINKFKYF